MPLRTVPKTSCGMIPVPQSNRELVAGEPLSFLSDD